MVDKNIVNRLWVNYTIDEGCEPPEYQTFGSSGLDLKASSDAVIRAGDRNVIGTGLKLEIPLGFEGQIRSRSGLAAKHGVIVLNSPGTIDCFTSDCLISTPTGKKSVFDLKINDVVFSMNEETLQIESDIVNAIVDVGEKEVIKFTFDDDTELCVTPGTMIYTREGLKRADQLTSNDEIIFHHDT